MHMPAVVSVCQTATEATCNDTPVRLIPMIGTLQWFAQVQIMFTCTLEFSTMLSRTPDELMPVRLKEKPHTRPRHSL